MIIPGHEHFFPSSVQKPVEGVRIDFSIFYGLDLLLHLKNLNYFTENVLKVLNWSFEITFSIIFDYIHIEMTKPCINKYTSINNPCL